MTEGAPWKHILRFALPVLAGSLLQQLYNTVDAIIVGNFSGKMRCLLWVPREVSLFCFLPLRWGFPRGMELS